MDMKFEIEGLKAIETALLKLEGQVAGKVLRSALNAALTPMQKAARARARKADETYLRTLRRSGKREGKRTLRGTGKREWKTPGTLRKAIRKKTWLGSRKGGNTKSAAGAAIILHHSAFYGRFLHEGTRYIAPDPFLTLAFESEKARTIERFKSFAWKKIQAIT